VKPRDILNVKNALRRSAVISCTALIRVCLLYTFMFTFSQQT